jgi:hypothetical protein
MAVVGVDVIHAAVYLAMNTREFPGADEAGFMPRRSKHDDVAGVHEFSVADPAVFHGHAKALLESERFAQERQSRGSIRVSQVGDYTLRHIVTISLIINYKVKYCQRLKQAAAAGCLEPCL